MRGLLAPASKALLLTFFCETFENVMKAMAILPRKKHFDSFAYDVRGVEAL